MTIAMSVVFSIFAGALTGYYLDNWLFDGRTSPWLTLVCLAMGVAGGAKNFVLLSRRFSREQAGRGDETDATGPDGSDQADDQR
ncbi:AtpZ/AtpI family protein [Dissulfurirhabdus thermomarina]|uniref:AtpZ/AtpI family protein n=2 Tax=Dissulfurirhabdus thermomarina TaxID=1765737 RepID=A0A6N9TQT0_DISTH|nr:AtpZ/AtpI family protein [Dissulfurirhabdus thermomarina]NMX22834.1 AtpZ/AtpI family protein [Dissulfurirhabdus thermomarina]